MATNGAILFPGLGNEGPLFFTSQEAADIDLWMEGFAQVPPHVTAAATSPDDGLVDPLMAESPPADLVMANSLFHGDNELLSSQSTASDDERAVSRMMLDWEAQANSVDAALTDQAPRVDAMMANAPIEQQILYHLPALIAAREQCADGGSTPHGQVQSNGAQSQPIFAFGPSSSAPAIAQTDGMIQNSLPHFTTPHANLAQPESTPVWQQQPIVANNNLPWPGTADDFLPQSYQGMVPNPLPPSTPPYAPHAGTESEDTWQYQTNGIGNGPTFPAPPTSALPAAVQGSGMPQQPLLPITPPQAAHDVRGTNPKQPSPLDVRATRIQHVDGLAYINLCLTPGAQWPVVIGLDDHKLGNLIDGRVMPTSPAIRADWFPNNDQWHFRLENTRMAEYPLEGYHAQMQWAVQSNRPDLLARVKPLFLQRQAEHDQARAWENWHVQRLIHLLIGEQEGSVFYKPTTVMLGAAAEGRPREKGKARANGESRVEAMSRAEATSRAEKRPRTEDQSRTMKRPRVERTLWAQEPVLYVHDPMWAQGA